MTIQARIQALVGDSFTDTTITQQFIDEAVRLVYSELPEEALESQAAEETDSGSGVDVTNKRVLDAHKSGYKAQHLDPQMRSRFTTLRTYDARPGWYIWSNTAYVVPDGGTVVTITLPTVAYTASTVTGVPSMLLDLIVQRAASLLIDHMMHELRDDQSVTVSMPTAPTAPSAPTISYSDATAVAPNATSIAALPSAPTYSSPSLASAPSAPTAGTLDLTKKVDGITSLAAPTAPSAPSIAYSDATAATVSATTIAALPAPPTYSTPSYGGSLSLPTLPTIDLTDELDGTTALDPPSAPSAPSIAYSDATAATVSATTISALGTAPTYTKPSAGGSLSLPSLPSDLDLTDELDGITALNPPTAPAAPSIAAVDANAATVVATTIGALPVPPTYSAQSFGGSLSAPSITAIDLGTEIDGATALNPPAVPAAPSITYSDATAATIGTTTVGTIPAAPTYSAPSFGGNLSLPSLPTLDLTDEIDGATALDPPATPSAPSIAYSDATGATTSATTVVALGTVPAYTKPTFGGSASIPVLPTLAYTNNVKGTTLTLPSAPAAPTIAYSDAALGTFAAAATVATLPTPPSLAAASFGGSIAAITSAVPSALSLASVTVPTPPSDPSLSSAGQASTTVDFATTVNGLAPTFTGAVPALDFTDWDVYFDGASKEDPEMMAGILNKVRTELEQEQLQHADNVKTFETELAIYQANVQKAVEDARLAAEEAANEMRQTDQMVLQDYMQELALYDRELAKYDADVRKLTDVYQAGLTRAVQGLAEAQRLYLEEYRMLVQESTAAYQGAVQDHMREADRVIEQARLDQQRLSEMFRAETDMNVQNEIQTLQALIADWQADWQLYQAQVQAYGQDVAHITEKWQLDFNKAVQPWVEEQRIHMETYRLDIENELNEFNKELVAYRQDAEHKIAQAQATLQEALADMRASTDASIQNEAQTLAALIRDWEGDVEVFQMGLTRYEAEINRQVQTFQLDYQKAFEPWAHQQTLYVQEYAHDIQAARDALSAQIQKHQADVQKVIDQAAADLQTNVEQGRLSTDVAVQNEIQTMNGLIQDYIYTLQQHQQDMMVYEAEVTRGVEEWKADFQRAIDPYMAEQQMQLQKYLHDIQQETESVRVDLEDYARESDRLIEQARITLQEAVSDAQNSTSAAIQNEANTLAALIRDWEGDVEVYQMQRQTYTDEIQRQLDEFDRNLAKATALWAEQQRLYMEQYNLDIQNERNEFEAALAEYRQDAEKKITQAQVTLQEALANARASTDAAVQNEARTLEAAIADFGADTQVFQAGLARYEAEIRRQLDEFDREYQKAYEPWAQQQALYTQQHANDIRAESDAFAGAMQDHMGEVQRVIDQAQITAREALENAQLATNVSIQNELQTLAGAVQDYEQELRLFQAKSQLYQLEVEAAVRQYTEDLDRQIKVYEAEAQVGVMRYQGEIEDARAALQQSMAVYQATLERANLQAQITAQEASQTARQSTDVALANEARTLEAAIQDYRLELELYQAEIAGYRAEIEDVISEYQAEMTVRREKARLMNFDRARIYEMYARTKAAFIKFMWPHRSHIIQQPII